MYLKKIEIYGFKSFGNKVELSFDNDVTCIVGPNGSGKSNIVDAVRWVLGEQRAKTLRGAKMEDIIFSGSEEKRALGYAYVSITIDNSKGVLPIDYTEVNISRRLFRSGESEYYINKNSVRLKDVQELFMDTGLSRGGYSIIGQGQIESIVNTSATDRKTLIEEAVGIVKYKTRKNEAIRKLDRTQANLYRITDIVSELEKRIPSLKRNSKKANEYLALREELKGIELNLFVHKIDALIEETAKINEDKVAINENLVQVKDKIQLTDEKYTSLKGEVSSYDEKIKTANEDIYNLINNYENSKIEVEVNKSKISNHIDNIRILEEKIERIESEIELKADEKEAAASQVTKAEETAEEIQAEYNAKKELVEELKSKTDETSSVLSSVQEKIDGLEKKLEEENENFSSNLSTKRNNSFIVEKLAEENKTHEENIALYEENLEKYKTIDYEKDLEVLEADLVKAAKEKDIIVKEEQSYKENISRLYNNVKLFKDKRELLTGYEDAKEGYKFAIKRLFEYVKNNKAFGANVYGTLGDIIKTEDKYSAAIEKSIGGAIENVVVKDENVAKEAINVLKQRKWGRITFLPHNIIKPGSELNITNEIRNAAGYLGVANELCSYDKKYENIVKNSLGRVLVFEDINRANKFARATSHRYKIATLEGEVLFPGGALVGGKSKYDDKNVLSRKNEIDALSKQIKQAEKEYDNLINNKKDYKALVLDFDKQISAVQEKIQDLKLGISMEADKVNNEREKIKSAADRISENKRQIAHSEEVIKDVNEQNIEIREKIGSLNKEIEGHKAELSKASMGAYKDEYVKESTTLSKIEFELFKAKEKVNFIKDSVVTIDKNVYEMKEEIEGAKNEIAQNNKEIDILSAAKEKALELDKDYDELKKSLDEKYASLVKDKEKASEEYDKVSKELLSLNEEKYEVSEMLNKLDNKIEKLGLESDYLKKGVLEDYNLTYNESIKYKTELDNLNKTDEDVKAIKDKIRKLGNINIEAIEEYKEVNDRFEFLSEQQADLTQAKEELLKIIKDMNDKIEEKFMREFSAIQTQFDMVFKQLFNGGQAKLVLTDPDDVMESGIEIEASPPKTKLKNISVLSGGEKSMTAIALIFAILQIKPAPFTILDEIDAALDDANVMRFCNYLSSIKEDNQFIVVTHRKHTMTIADVLYGATMGIEGITRIVSVKLKDVTEGGEIVNG